VDIFEGDYKGLVYGLKFSCGKKIDFPEGRTFGREGTVKYRLIDSFIEEKSLFELNREIQHEGQDDKSNK
jgi:hypothetical protein